jgi:hypothetical protein
MYYEKLKGGHKTLTSQILYIIIYFPFILNYLTFWYQYNYQIFWFYLSFTFMVKIFISLLLSEILIYLLCIVRIIIVLCNIFFELLFEIIYCSATIDSIFFLQAGLTGVHVLIYLDRKTKYSKFFIYLIHWEIYNESVIYL